MMLKALSNRIDRIFRIWFRILVKYSNRSVPDFILLNDRAHIRYSNDFIPFIVL